MPTVSALIPTYNCARYLPEAIESLLAQERRPDQIVVVDDGSTDNTAEVLTRYPVIAVRQSNHGCAGAARNRGLQLCTGDYIAFLDADDIALDRIGRQAQFLDEHPRVGAVMTDFVNFRDKELWPTTHYGTCPRITKALGGDPFVVFKPDLARDMLLDENYALPSTMMIRREVLSWVPGFAFEPRLGQDALFIYQVAKRFDIGLMAMVGAQRRVHGNNISGDMLNYLRDKLTRHEVLAALESNVALRTKTRGISKMLRRLLARELADRGQYRESLAQTWDPKTLLRTLVMAMKRGKISS